MHILDCAGVGQLEDAGRCGIKRGYDSINRTAALRIAKVIDKLEAQPEGKKATLYPEQLNTHLIARMSVRCNSL